MTFAGIFLVLVGLLPIVSPLSLPVTAHHGLPDLNRFSPVPEVMYRGPVRGITHWMAKGGADQSPDEPAPVSQSLLGISGRADGHSAASAVGRALGRVLGAGLQNVTSATPMSTQYAVSVLWDSTPVWLLLDTGSSDTWAISPDFKCVDSYGDKFPRGACAQGPDFVDGFAHGAIPNLHFDVRFGSGEFASGPMGLSDLSVAGLVVRRLKVGLANVTYWQGNNLTDGILGLGYESLTSAYFGPSGDNGGGQEFLQNYPPFFAQMIGQGVIKRSYFSVAIDRGASTGMVGWGGLPPVEYLDEFPASTDILITTINPSRPDSAWKYSYYTIVVDGLQWGQTTNTNRYLYIVDTGTTLLYLPPPLAEAVAAAYNPPAVYLWQYGSYFASCDAIPPQLSIMIDGRYFAINPQDLIYPMQDPITGFCQIGIANGGVGPYILGDVFLQNVVAVFDVGAAKMRFYGRP